MSKPLIVFDMDGVLVDVTESYREAIQQTVRHFTGQDISRDAIQDFKNQGGWNDDWKLSHHIITGRGVDVTLDAVTEYFQGIFHGDGTNGLILREEWIAKNGTFDELSRDYRLAVFTGRQKWEAEYTLRRFAPEVEFAPIIGMYEVENLKPAPDGLLKIQNENPGVALWYVGDTVDDARCARAAGVPFVGVASERSLRRDELIALFEQQGARAVIADINSLAGVLKA